MMKHLLHLFIVLVLPLAVSSTELIQEACKETSHKDLCIETLQLDPSTQKADLKGLLVIMLKAAHKKARRTCEKIPGLVEGEKDAFIEQCLNNCKEQYMDAVDQIEDSIQALESSGYSDAKTWATAALGDVQACEEEFSSKSPLTADNDVFVQLCRISLSILKLHVGSKSNNPSLV